jgi:hypothetical protein
MTLDPTLDTGDDGGLVLVVFVDQIESTLPADEQESPPDDVTFVGDLESLFSQL